MLPSLAGRGPSLSASEGHAEALRWRSGSDFPSGEKPKVPSARRPILKTQVRIPRALHVREEVGVFWSILHRTILWELVRVFLLSLLGITGMLLMAGIVAEATQHGLSPAQILGVIPLLVPSTLPYTIPATTLFATCVVYGRLAHDNEILAIKAAGINILRVIWPAVLLGLLMSALTMGLYVSVIPCTHHLMRSMVLSDVEDLLYSILRQASNLTSPR